MQPVDLPIKTAVLTMADFMKWRWIPCWQNISMQNTWVNKNIRYNFKYTWSCTPNSLTIICQWLFITVRKKQEKRSCWIQYIIFELHLTAHFLRQDRFQLIRHYFKYRRRPLTLWFLIIIYDPGFPSGLVFAPWILEINMLRMHWSLPKIC